MKHSITLIIWSLTVFITYLLSSLAVSIIQDISYRAVLCDHNQLIAFIFIYWWLPAIFVAAEVYEWIDERY